VFRLSCSDSILIKLFCVFCRRNACKILVGKPEGKRPLERLRRTWVDNIKMDLRGI
jgi:hypothetical protein